MNDKRQIEEIKKQSIVKAIPIVAGILLAVAAIAFIICREVSEFYYDQKWKDYDECGLG